MLGIIMFFLTVIFIGGLIIMVNDKSKITAVDIVAIISPALAAVGTVAAGISATAWALKVPVMLNKSQTE